MPSWFVEDGQDGLHLTPVVRRALGSEELTWAELLSGFLSPARVYCLYFPSRFDLPIDAEATTTLRTFGDHTGKDTTVDFWDPKDAEFSRALALFGIDSPPALVFVSGLKLKGANLSGPEGASLYAITITDQAVLGDAARLALATNTAHELVARGDPKRIAGYLRKRSATSLLQEIERISTGIRDQLVLLKPKISLPGGVALQLG
jgi:hypothetical protein